MNNRLPLVSVVMPAFNAEQYIYQSIESILNQTYRNFEFIIIDDASTDSTWKIIKSYQKKDARIRAYKNKKNLYIAGVRNLLINKVRGEYVAWQDADDISISDRLFQQVQYLNEHPSVGIVGGYLLFFDETGKKSIRKYAESDETLRKYIFKFSPVSQPTAMIRKICFDKLGKFNKKYPPAEDIDMSFRIGTQFQFANIQKVLMSYRESYNSATFTRLKKMELATIEIRLKYSHYHCYRWTLSDLIYNFFHYLSIFLVPPRLKISIFNKFRNSSL